MGIRIFAIAAVTVIIIASLAAATLKPDSWPQVMQIALPTITALLVLVKVQDYHLVVNSRMDELLKATDRAGRAEGKAEGKAEGP